MSTNEDTVKQVFGERAESYTTSATHTETAVLDRLVEMSGAEHSSRALDVATGTGHTAFALSPHVKSVTAADITIEMLTEAVGLKRSSRITNVHLAAADAHSLPFMNDSFDLVTSRRAPHHFSDIHLALSEMVRVLRPGGRLVIDDRSVPDDRFVDECMNELDTLHDPSHVRQYKPSEWQTMLEKVGLIVDIVEPYTRHRPLSALTGGVPPDDVKKIHRKLESLSPSERDSLDLREVDGELHLTHWFVMIAAQLP